MKLDKDTYSKAEVEDIVKGINKQVADITTQLTTAQESLKGYDELKKDNLASKIRLELANVGLSDDLFDLVNSEDVETAKGKIKKMSEIMKAKKVDDSYKPESHKQENAYTNAKEKGNVSGMIASKFNKLFN